MRAEPLVAEARVSDGATADSVSAYLERLIEEDEGRERLCKFTDEHFEGVDTVGPLTLAPCLCVVRRRRAPEQRARATTMTTRRIHKRGRGRFITGYDIVPGAPEIVHHVLVMVVDPDAPADLTEASADLMLPAGATNAQVMAALDAESPDKPGWPCWGQAGEGVFVRSTPVVWAPGQGVVHFPGDSGASLRPTDKLVVQVHYNLHDPALRGKTDETHVRLELAEHVPNLALLAVPDALLESLFDPEPDTLEPGKASVLYSFERTVEELDLEDSTGGALAEARLAELKLWGVMPHMHERGRKFQMRVQSNAASDATCAVDVQSWDFHWQRMYFYEKPKELNADSQFEITCDYDTSSAQAPVTPGWGTNNEMCLATLFFTVPER